MITYSLNKENQNRSGVYCIINMVDGKKYIGSTVNLRDRMRSHLVPLSKGTHSSKKLQYAANKHGVRNFKFFVLSTIDKENLIEYEQFCIDEFKPEYNIRKEVDSNRGNRAWNKGLKNTIPADQKVRMEIALRARGAWNKGGFDEKNKKIKQDQFSKKVVCYDLNGNYLSIYSSIAECAKHLMVTNGAVISNLKNRSKTCSGHILKYWEHNFQIKIEPRKPLNGGRFMYKNNEGDYIYKNK